MFFQFFDELRSARVPVTLKEYLALMDAMSKDVIDMKIDEFYYLSRTALVKDERNLDKFDRVFRPCVQGARNARRHRDRANSGRMAARADGKIPNRRGKEAGSSRWAAGKS